MIDDATLLKLRDPKFYLENFCKIKGKTPGLIPFILTDAQKDLYNVLRKHTRVIALKARQIGFSTAVAGYLYHKTITTPGTTTALVAHKSDVAAEFLDKVKTFWRTTPDSLRPQIHYNSKYEISFPALDSKIMVMSGENVGRGFTIHNVLASELAMWDKPEEMMTALENAVPISGQIIIESTPMGVGNKFHKMWMEDNGYEKRRYGWWWHYSEAEIELIRKNNDPMKFAQEYELEFLAAGRQVFDPRLVKEQRRNILEVGDKVKIGSQEHVVYEDSDHVRIYKPVESDHNYVVGADVAEGVVGGDYSVAVVWDRNTGEEVAFYRGHIAADRFGALLSRLGRLYNNALMVVEINNHGLTTVTALKNLHYPSLYFRPAKFDSVGTTFTDRIGWKTTKVTRPLMIDDLHEAMRENAITFHSKELLDEMLVFIFNDNGDMEAQGGFHDDCIFGAAIGFQGFKMMYTGPMDQLDYTQHLPSNFAY